MYLVCIVATYHVTFTTLKHTSATHKLYHLEPPRRAGAGILHQGKPSDGGSCSARYYLTTVRSSLWCMFYCMLQWFYVRLFSAVFSIRTFWCGTTPARSPMLLAYYCRHDWRSCTILIRTGMITFSCLIWWLPSLWLQQKGP